MLMLKLMLHTGLASFYANLTEGTFIWEEGILPEKMPPWIGLWASL